MAKYERKCRICGSKEYLYYIYTREPTVWNGWFYCRDEQERRALQRDTKREGKRTKRREPIEFLDETIAPDNREKQPTPPGAMELGNGTRRKASVVRRRRSSEAVEREKRIRSDRLGERLQRSENPSIENEEREVLQGDQYSISEDTPASHRSADFRVGAKYTRKNK